MDRLCTNARQHTSAVLGWHAARCTPARRTRFHYVRFVSRLRYPVRCCVHRLATTRPILGVLGRRRAVGGRAEWLMEWLSRIRPIDVDGGESHGQEAAVVGVRVGAVCYAPACLRSTWVQNVRQEWSCAPYP
eukprot:7242279-Prymnesium_polylepis.1